MDLPAPSGGAGTGDKRLTPSTAARSSCALPDDFATRTDVTRPDPSTAKATVTRPPPDG